MNNVSEIREKPLCANGCVRKGTENNDRPTPFETAKGNLCIKCFGKMRNALDLAPTVVEHVVSLINTKGGQADDRVDDANAEAPLPFNTQAFNDGNEIYQRLVYWSILWADRLGVQAPGPAVRAWRARNGFVVGLPVDIAPGSARYISGIMASWLRLKLEEICYLTLDDVNYFADELKDVYRINARWPQEAKPYFSKMPCPDDRGRIAVYPPTEFGEDVVYKCDTCGRMFDEAQHEFYSHLFRQTVAAPNVRAHLVRKYAEGV